VRLQPHYRPDRNPFGKEQAMADRAHNTPTDNARTAARRRIIRTQARQLPALPEPLAHFAVLLADRRQVKALAAALIDFLDATEDTDSDLDVEDLVVLRSQAVDRLPGDPDDAEAGDAEDDGGWTASADGLPIHWPAIQVHALNGGVA
jgi:hypothetical protein